MELESALISNTTCGNNSGFIFLQVQGGNDAFSFDWNPAISSTSSASALGAGSYRVVITRNAQPQCKLDTTLIVNNSNGPTLPTPQITPANCSAANGKIQLPPGVLSYNWSTGVSGPQLLDLPAGCYLVTATATNGCYSIHQICVPRNNPLESTVAVLEPAKCGLATGSAAITVTGGVGPYSYFPGGSSIIDQLTAGLKVVFVTDLSTSCIDTVIFTIPPAQVDATILLNPLNIRCPDGSLGNLSFEVIPGSNFALPYVFSLSDANGNQYSPGALPAGFYTLQIRDADNCPVPSKSFFISQPPPFSADLMIQAGVCGKMGAIKLSPSGGNGKFLVDWQDLPGFDNPANRENLKAGYYEVDIYDSLFCRYSFDSLRVADWCDVPNIRRIYVAAGQTDTFCLAPAVGLTVLDHEFQLLPGKSATGQSAYGLWTLNSEGCLIYAAGDSAVLSADTICLVRKSPIAGFSDTLCVVVNITEIPAERDSIYFAVQSGNVATACGVWPDNFILPTIQLANSPGLIGRSDVFGDYSVNSLTGCLTFISNGPTGYNIDAIDVAICENTLKQCKINTYLPTILGATDCVDGISLPDSLWVEASNCQVGATICLPLPFGQVFDYAVLSNGVPYQKSYTPCQPDTVESYTLNLTGGPFRLESWEVGNQIRSGYFTDVYDLLNLVNALDSSPGWTLQNNSVLLGGNASTNYGLMRIIGAFGDTLLFQPGKNSAFLGTNLVLPPGDHLLIFRRLQTGCVDSTWIRVTCVACPTFYSYTPGVDGSFRFPVVSCKDSLIFCTTIGVDAVPGHIILDNGSPAVLATCDPSQAGILLDTGFHLVMIRNVLTQCADTFPVWVDCIPVKDTTLAVDDDAVIQKNTPVVLNIFENDIILGVEGNISGLLSATLTSTPGFGVATFNPTTGELKYTPETDRCGLATLTYRITDTYGRTSDARVSVQVFCEQVLIFTGLSPNGDGSNDTWTILGIEQFPGNQVRVFNRWGNLVFEQEGYSNQNPWNGQWNGSDLPDGTYFYQVELNDGNKPISGYLEIFR